MNSFWKPLEGQHLFQLELVNCDSTVEVGALGKHDLDGLAGYRINWKSLKLVRIFRIEVLVFLKTGSLARSFNPASFSGKATLKHQSDLVQSLRFIELDL